MSELVATTCSHCPWCGTKLSRVFDCAPVFDSGFCHDSYYKAEGQVQLVTPVLKETGGNVTEAARRLKLSPSTVARYAAALGVKTKRQRRAQYIALRVREAGGHIAETALRLSVSRSTITRYLKIAMEET